jgi:hypothetical protein
VEALGRSLAHSVIAGTLICAGLCVPRPAAAYSVLAHEANIDAMWDPTIKTMLHVRFPNATDDEIAAARAFAYGGCVIQDLGYHPFGSRFFSNLLHYAADNSGHPMEVNRAVPLMYPKLKARFGNPITYMQSPKSHVLVEFSFDVVQVAAGAYAPEAYHSYIGFKVAKPALERAYGIADLLPKIRSQVALLKATCSCP